MPGNNSTTVLLGCEPFVELTIFEDQGSLVLLLDASDRGSDIDGLFFNISGSSALGSLTIFPMVDTREITGFEAAPDSATTLANGATVAEGYDVGVQFGTSAGSTSGEVTTTGFTIYADDGTPLTIADLDLTNIVAVVDSDSGTGLALTPADGASNGASGGAVVEVTEDFDDIRDPAQSDMIASDDAWKIRQDALFTNGANDGTVLLEPVETDEPVSLSFDARARGLHQFENSGHGLDTLRVEVQIDNGSWVLLDEFTINDAGTALVGSETGQQIGPRNGPLTYEGGVLDDVSETAQFRIVSDITSNNERIFIDNLEIVTTEAAPLLCPTEIVTEDFEGLASGDTVDGQFEGLTVSAQKSGDSDDSPNDAMIFDTANPTGGDRDLGYDDQGNAVIISEDGDSSDADDNMRGGTITFSFTDPSDVVSLRLLDVEEAGGTIDLFDEDGELIETVDIPTTGDNGEQEVAINVSGVAIMDVNLTGSGAVDDLRYVPGHECAPCDDEYLVDYLGMPLVAMSEEDPDMDDEAELHGFAA